MIQTQNKNYPNHQSQSELKKDSKHCFHTKLPKPPKPIWVEKAKNILNNVFIQTQNQDYPNHQSQSELIKPKQIHNNVFIQTRNQNNPNHQSQSEFLKLKKNRNNVLIQTQSQNYPNHQSQSEMKKPNKFHNYVLIHLILVAIHKIKNSPITMANQDWTCVWHGITWYWIQGQGSLHIVTDLSQESSRKRLCQPKFQASSFSLVQTKNSL